MTPTPTLVEKMGEVIWDGLNKRIPGAYQPFKSLPDPQVAMLMETAHAAFAVVIAEMREPSEEMLEAAVGEKAHHALVAKAFWYAMLAQFEKEQAGG